MISIRSFLYVIALFGLFISLAAEAATYSFPNGPLPSGCSKQGNNRVNCGNVNLGLDDVVNLTRSVTWTINGSANFNSRVRINPSASSALSINIASTFTTETDVSILANVTVGSNTVLKDRTRLTGNLVSTGTVTFESGVVINGNTSAGGNIAIRSAGTISGNLASTSGNVTLEAGTRIAGNVSARRTLELKSNVQVSGSLNPGKLVSEADVVIIQSGSYVTGSVTAARIENYQAGSISGSITCSGSNGSVPVSCNAGGGSVESCPMPQAGVNSLAGKVIVNEMSFHGDNANGDWFELYVKDGVHNLQGWKVTLKGRGGIDKQITLPNVTIPWSSANNGKFLIFAASTANSAIQAGIQKGILQQGVNLFIDSNIELHNTLQEILVTDASNNLVYYIGYANNSSTSERFVYSCAEDYPQFADAIINMGNENTACTLQDGVSSGNVSADWSAGCNNGESTVGYSNAGDSVLEPDFSTKYRVEHVTTGTVGQPVNLTIKACISDDCSSLLPGNVTGQIAITSGGGALSQSSLNFSGGQAVVQLTPNSAGSIIFSLSNMRVSAGSLLSPATPVCLDSADLTNSSCRINVSTADICFEEPFNNNANWYLTQRGATPPSLQNGRLQLTTNQKNQSTSVTFKQGFPAANNKLTIEFDHFAYNGNGADGIAMVLSDATVVPVPGSYGGSLGYAQRTNISPAQPGFAGGWLGIGFDEFGNFSQAAEGRSGGVTGLRPNAIGVRAAASANYGWMGGTSSQGDALWASGSAPARGDRYRVTIDSVTNSPSVTFRLERKLFNSASYSTLLTSTNLVAGGQPAPPTNMLLSFTGSTGDNTNIHAIDNVKVCTVRPSTPIEIGSQFHHFELSYGQGVTCESNQVQVKACANEGCSELYTSPVSVTLAANNGALWPTGATVNLVNGIATLNLAKTVAGNTTLNITSSSVNAGNSLRCLEAGNLDSTCTVPFNNTGLRFSTINNQVAGLWSDETNLLRIIETVPETLACAARVVPAANVGMAHQCVNPSSCIAGQALMARDGTTTETLTANDLNAGSWSYKDVTLSFSSAQSDFALKYSDVGQIRLKARLVLAATPTQPAVTLEALSNEFVVRPDRIVVQSVSRLDGSLNPATTSEGNGFVAAGENFKVVLDVLNREGSRTPNFGRETTAERLGLQNTLAYPSIIGVNCPSGVTPCTPNPDVLVGSAGFTAVSGTGGRFESSEVSWLQAGSINLSGKISDSDYLGAGDTASANPAVLVGRFYPDRFILQSSGSANSCVIGAFTYMSQPAISANAELRAVATNGSTLLTNYNSMANKMYAGTAALQLKAVNGGTATDLSGRLSGYTAATWQDGVWSWSQSNLSFTKQTSFVPDGPFASLQLGLNVQSELDSRVLTSNMAIGATAVGSPLNLLFGRLVVRGGNVADAATSGSTPVAVLLGSEYWNGSGFVTNMADNCTQVNAANLSFDSSGAALTADGITQTLNAGVSIDYSNQNASTNPNWAQGFRVNVPASATGIWPVFYTAPTWLKYNWVKESGAAVEENPFSEVSVGRFRGNKRQIFWQERLN